MVLLDPDNGFEPKGPFGNKHIRYSELAVILDQIGDNSLLSVFQHFRRVKFEEDFRRIKGQLGKFTAAVHITGIYWHQLMFVLISKSAETIGRVRVMNKTYVRAIALTSRKSRVLNVIEA